MFTVLNHNALQIDTPPSTAQGVLGAVRRANLHNQLYPDPQSVELQRVLEALSDAALIAFIPATATSLGGWWAPRARGS